MSHQLPLPNSDRHPEVRLTITHPMGSSTVTLDDTHKVMNLDAPEGVDIRDVEVVAEFICRDGNPDPLMKPMLLKSKEHYEDTQEHGDEPGPVHGDEPRSEVSDEDKVDEHPTADGGEVGEAELKEDKVEPSDDL